ncbi:MAG: amidohydrolase family protein [Halanaerobiaceae bacterium]
MTDLKKLSLFDYKPEPQLITEETHIKKAKYEAVDAHNHLRHIVDKSKKFIDEYVKRLDECNVKAVVNLDGGWGENLDRHLETFKKPYPDRFYVLANIDWSDVEKPDFSKRAVKKLEESIEKGARGLKIFKKLGLGVKDTNGNYLPVDTPRMDPVWEKCGELNIPVLIHTSDPAAFFTPLDEHNERLEELIDHPDWMFNQPEYYSKSELLQQRNNVIARHPDTVFIGAHVGNYPENLKKVSVWLDKYPNFYVDLSARLSELGRQPYSARKFIINYADRILMGTDGNAMGQPVTEMYRLHWRFFESDDEYFDIAKSHKFQGRWKVHGMFLPDQVLKQIYYENALKLFS